TLRGALSLAVRRLAHADGWIRGSDRGSEAVDRLIAFADEAGQVVHVGADAGGEPLGDLLRGSLPAGPVDHGLGHVGGDSGREPVPHGVLPQGVHGRVLGLPALVGPVAGGPATARLPGPND